MFDFFTPYTQGAFSLPFPNPLFMHRIYQVTRTIPLLSYLETNARYFDYTPFKFQFTKV